MTTKLVFALVFCLCFVTLRGHEEVRLPEGGIRGTTMMTRNGRNISAYLGIPYAEPPLGPLRFRHPERKSNFWYFIPGDTDGNICPQLNDNGELIGAEDCLFLNIYTPQAIPRMQYPVMVYFHGNNFAKGSGSSKEAGPEYFLDRDIVLVTVNYRLGALGFLSTGDAQASGNFGLKDQVVALQWIRDNIIAFGGDPNGVTIFGQGAGGACASLHAIAPASRGLFSKYISQSGNAMAFWAFHDIKHYADHSTALGEKLNCPTKDSRALIECLRGVDVYNLVNSDDIFHNKYFTFSTWGPTIENIPGAFLTQLPLHQTIMRGINDVPSMIGVVADEGLIMTAAFRTNNTTYDEIARNSYNFFLYVTKLFFTDYKTEIYARNAEKFYFNGSDPKDKNVLSQVITEFITDAGFIVPMELQVRATTHETKSPLYEYSFDYRGTFSHSSLTAGSNENIGVAHGDDLIYLFPMNPKLKTSSELEFSESDERMIDTMIDLWTSFAYTGTPMVNSTSHPYMWEASGSKMSYLKIGNQSDPELTTQHGLGIDSVAFWNKQLGYQISNVLRNTA